MENLPSIDSNRKLILGKPDADLSYASIPVKDIGLLQQEFVVANHIGIQPNAVLLPEKVSKAEQIIINEMSFNDPSPKDFLVRKVSEGIGSTAAAFYTILSLSAWETSSLINIAV